MLKDNRFLTQLARCVLLVISLLSSTGLVDDQSGQVWTQFTNVSLSPTPSYSPDITVDRTGRVHVVWAEALASDTTIGTGDTIMHAFLDHGIWSAPVDILLPLGGPIVRGIDITVDPKARLHIVWMGGYESKMYHASALAENANSAQAWSTPSPLDVGQTVGFDMVIDEQGSLHIAYIQPEPYYQVYYLKSMDGGETWTEPVQVSLTEPGTVVAEVQLAIDSGQNAHVVWQEGTNEWPPTGVLYARSKGNEQDWGQPQYIDQKNPSYREDYGPGLIGVGVTEKQQVHLVWNGPPLGYRTHQWSQDNGLSWRDRGMVASDLQRDFRYFTGKPVLIGNTADEVHLVTSSSLGLSYVRWNFGAWSNPVGQVNPASCLNPHAVIGLGTILHAVCFNDSNLEIEYASLNIDASPIAPEPYPPIVTTPAPTLSVQEAKDTSDTQTVILSPDPMSTGQTIDQVSRLRPALGQFQVFAISLIPVTAFVLAIAFATIRRRYH